MTTIRPLTTLTPIEQSVLDAVMPIIHDVERTQGQIGGELVVEPRCPFCDHLVSKHSSRGCTHRVAMKYAEQSLWWKTSGRCLCAVGVEDPPEQLEITTLSDPEPRYVDGPTCTHAPGCPVHPHATKQHSRIDGTPFPEPEPDGAPEHWTGR